jgi:1,4-dihydroxy-2-naphthoyl-CoA hydrolase
MDLAVKDSPYHQLVDHSPEAFNRWGARSLPGHLGIEIVSTAPERLVCRVPIQPAIMAPHGYLHGGTVVAIADSLCGYGCVVNLPERALGFTTIELKTNFLGTARSGTLVCEARPLHLGRTTQVWDATLSHEESQEVLASFRCTQLVLWPQRSI